MKNADKRLIDISKIKVSAKVKSHANDPFVLKKLEEARRVLKSLEKIR